MPASQPSGVSLGALPRCAGTDPSAGFGHPRQRDRYTTHGSTARSAHLPATKSVSPRARFPRALSLQNSVGRHETSCRWIDRISSDHFPRRGCGEAQSYSIELSFLLRTSHERPRSHSTDKRKKLPPPHSITSSARARRVGGTATPSTFAALRLITNSNVVGSSTGKSAGRAPFNILSAWTAARAKCWQKLRP
jgi:hypothetical protein